MATGRGAALHTAECVLRPVHIAAGRLGEAVVGTLVGLIIVSAATLWFPLLELSLPELALMAIVVLVVAEAWELAVSEAPPGPAHESWSWALLRSAWSS